MNKLQQVCQLIVMMILVLKDTLIIWKCQLKIDLYYPAKIFIRKVWFMFMLRIKDKVPLRMGWCLVNDIRKRVDEGKL